MSSALVMRNDSNKNYSDYLHTEVDAISIHGFQIKRSSGY